MRERGYFPVAFSERAQNETARKLLREITNPISTPDEYRECTLVATRVATERIEMRGANESRHAVHAD